MIATRNIIAHNGGYVDSRYLKAVRSSRLKLGERRRLNSDEIIELEKIFNKTAELSDRAIAEKLQLELVDI